ncbi:MAG: tRNA preQ1(34) S-adenosylmethionine ribosyltransferase-isomerase QueA [Pseudomonadota bacterium]
MRMDAFDFELPDDLIALAPISPRDAARMLVVRPDDAAPFTNGYVRDLPRLLGAGDVLVVNDTRVIPAALNGRRTRGENVVPVQINLIRRRAADTWDAFAKPGRRLAVGDMVEFGDGRLSAEVFAKDEAGIVTFRFGASGPALDDAIAIGGAMPLPPYIASRRSATDDDDINYQTVYAERDGAVAAPTAGLHFTPELLEALRAAGVDQQTLTLHVGAGTFLPVKTNDLSTHVMHAEWGELTPATADALNRARDAGGRIVAVGTTVLRLLETAVQRDGRFQPFVGETDIFLKPGRTFRSAEVLMTNFHLPRSTLFMLVAAFAGLETMQAAYAHAIAQRYRFYSYGDSSLLFRAKAAA